jgi:hypothetical protein
MSYFGESTFIIGNIWISALEDSADAANFCTTEEYRAEPIF